jgi:hypothetical protein
MANGRRLPASWLTNHFYPDRLVIRSDTLFVDAGALEGFLVVAFLGAGFAVQCSERCSTYLYYDGELGRSNFDRHSVSGGVRVSF